MPRCRYPEYCQTACWRHRSDVRVSHPPVRLATLTDPFHSSEEYCSREAVLLIPAFGARGSMREVLRVCSLTAAAFVGLTSVASPAQPDPTMFLCPTPAAAAGFWKD